MAPKRPRLNYASARSRGPSAARDHLLLGVGCFGASWLVWLVIALATFDPFDDSLGPWVGFVVAVPGTVCGLVVWVIALLVMHLRFVGR